MGEFQKFTSGVFGKEHHQVREQVLNAGHKLFEVSKRDQAIAQG